MRGMPSLAGEKQLTYFWAPREGAMTFGCSAGHTCTGHTHHCDISKCMAAFVVMEAICHLGC